MQRKGKPAERRGRKVKNPNCIAFFKLLKPGTCKDSLAAVFFWAVFVFGVKLKENKRKEVDL